MFQGRLVEEWGILQEVFLDENNVELKLDRHYYTIQATSGYESL
jgi:hypothetical protein